MAKVIETVYEKKTVVEYLTQEVKRVGLVFYHGIGDCMLFATSYDKLVSLYPQVHFDLFIPKGLDEELIFSNAIVFDNLDKVKELTDYDYIFLIHFPVETGECTKSELCCRLELGIEDTSGYKTLPLIKSRLIGVHFHNTALPEVLNCPKEIAEKIWNEILEAGAIPIDLHFQHVFHNPVNSKYDFIDCSVRRVKPQLSTLVGLIQSCSGIIAVASGPFHCSMGIDDNKVMFIQNMVSKEAFTHKDIPVIDINNYKEGQVREWVRMIIE